MADTYLIQAPLHNYFFKNDATAAVNGSVEVFFPAGQSVTKATLYSDRAATVAIANPILLSSNGGAAPFYVKAAQEYRVVIKDSAGAILNTVDNWMPNDDGTSGGGGSGTSMNNGLTNGQFDEIRTFTKSSDIPGTVYTQDTNVAPGWFFRQNSPTTTKNLLTYQNVSTESLEGHPMHALLITSSDIQAGESLRDLRQEIGQVNAYAGQDITFNCQMKSYAAGTTTTVTLLVEYNYGTGNASPGEIITLTTFSVTNNWQKFNFNHTLKQLTGKTVTEDSSLTLTLRYEPGQIISVGTTNLSLLRGKLTNPIYVKEDFGTERSREIGMMSTFLDNNGLDTNYEPISLDGNGNLASLSQSGRVVLAPTNHPPHASLLCDGTHHNVSDYVDNTPLKRLYEVLPNAATTGDLIVTSAGADVTFESKGGSGAPATPFTVGTATSNFTLENDSGSSSPLGGGGFTATVATDGTVDIDRDANGAYGWSLTAIWPYTPTPDYTGITNFLNMDSNSDSGVVQPFYAYPWTASAGGSAQAPWYPIVSDSFGVIRYIPNNAPGPDWQYAVENRGFTIPNYTNGSATTKYGFQIKPVSTDLGGFKINTVTAQGWPDNNFGNQKYAGTGVTGVIGVPDTASSTGGQGVLGYGDLGQIGPTQKDSAWPSIVMYFTVDGQGAFPPVSFGASSRTIVPLKSGDTAMQISHKIAASVVGSFEYKFTCTSVPVPSGAVAKYIEVASDTVSYYVWFEVAGVGTDPAIAGKTGKKITLTALDTPTTTAAAIAQTMNSLTFATPTIASATTGFSNFILI